MSPKMKKQQGLIQKTQKELTGKTAEEIAAEAKNQPISFMRRDATHFNKKIGNVRQLKNQAARI